MIWWTVDNFGLVLLVLFPVILGCLFFWWASGNFKTLIGAGVSAGLMLVAFLLWLFVVTDRRQLVRDVETMAELVNAGKMNDALEHFDDEVRVFTMHAKDGQVFKRTDLGNLTKGNMANYGVRKVAVNMIKVRELSRPNAKVTFLVGPEDGAERGVCRMDFVLSSEGKWRVCTFSVEQMGSGQKTPLLFPFGK